MNINPAQLESQRNRAAEDRARHERLDEDRIILAALEALDSAARYRVINEDNEDSIAFYIAGAANIPTSGHAYPGESVRYVRARIAAIRGRLSPVVS